MRFKEMNLTTYVTGFKLLSKIRCNYLDMEKSCLITTITYLMIPFLTKSIFSEVRL